MCACKKVWFPTEEEIADISLNPKRPSTYFKGCVCLRRVDTGRTRPRRHRGFGERQRQGSLAGHPLLSLLYVLLLSLSLLYVLYLSLSLSLLYFLYPYLSLVCPLSLSYVLYLSLSLVCPLSLSYVLYLSRMSPHTAIYLAC
jgi:hypothetical protein